MKLSFSQWLTTASAHLYWHCRWIKIKVHVSLILWNDPDLILVDTVCFRSFKRFKIIVSFRIYTLFIMFSWGYKQRFPSAQLSSVRTTCVRCNWNKEWEKIYSFLDNLWTSQSYWKWAIRIFRGAMSAHIITEDDHHAI